MKRTLVAVVPILAWLLACAGSDEPADTPTDVPADTAIADPGPAPDAPDAVDAADDVDTRDAPDAAPDVPPVETVRVVRDQWGVPHVLGASDYGAGYGYGWALAEDRLVEALNGYWSAQGRRTEIDGEAALEFDRTFRLTRIVEDLEAEWGQQPQAVRDLGEGFAAGFNRYMAEHPDQVPAWAEPIRPAWTLALGRFLFADMEVSRANRDIDVDLELCPRFVTLDQGLDDRHYGSNGWAIAPGRTANGVGLMSGDPHLPWKNEYRFHEVHLRSPSIDVAGAAFIGVPLPVLGRNAHVAWTWTSNSLDYGDAFRLTLNPENPDEYLFDGKYVPFETREDAFRLPDGTVREQTLRWSIHGAVACVNPARGQAVAIRTASSRHNRMGEQILGMHRARDLDEVEKAMELLQFPHFAIVAADTKGHVRFVWQGRVPKRPAGYEGDYHLYDGTTSAAVWDPDDPIPYSQMPAVRDPAIGFVQNCNNRPQKTTGTDADPDPSSFPPGVVQGNDLDEVRSYYVRRRLTDEPKWTSEAARAMTTEGYMIPHDPLKDLLIYAWTAYGADYEHKAEVEELIELLRDWDGWADPESSAPTTFLVWLFTWAGETFIPVEALQMTPADVDETEGAKMLAALYDARTMIEGVAGFATVPWGLLHVIRKNGEVFPVATGQYPAISLMNANLDPTAVSGFEDLNCTVGSAYTFFNEMTEPIKTWSVQPLGQTERADLPWVTAQTELFAQRELKPLPYTDAEIQEHKLSEIVLVVGGEPVPASVGL